ncbi:MAG: hypothetical protein LBF78_06400 [Treponema sp.]|nr:hypothetical protein [Treponema sp.]
MRKLIYMFLIFLPALNGAAILGAAEFTIPRMEMATWGKVESGDFILSSAIQADLSLSGGYKYGMLLGFNFETPDIMTTRASSLSFRIAKASARDLFGKPLELSFFIGDGDDFCSGDEFSTRFGIVPIETEYQGFSYFPDGIRYDGIHSAMGTGFSLALTKWEHIVPMIYLYEDFIDTSGTTGFFDNDGKAHYSGDLRVLINLERVKIEAFSGLSLTKSSKANVRAGLLADFITESGMEFLFQGGIPGWDAGTSLKIDHFFFLMEPRLRFAKYGFIMTFFYHPVEYLHIKTDEERGKVDINAKFYLGKPDAIFKAGLESTFGMKVTKMDDLALWVSPFATFSSGGLLWDTKIRINVLDTDPPAEMFGFFFGVRTSF